MTTAGGGVHKLSRYLPRMVTLGVIGGSGVAYFLAALLGLALKSHAGLAFFWPAGGIATGALIVLGPAARLPVTLGMVFGSIACSLTVGRSPGLAVAFAVPNVTEALLTAWLVERWFGAAFKLEEVSQVLGFLVASAIAAAIGAASAAIVVSFVEPTELPLQVWRVWFSAGLLGTVTVAPLLIELAGAVREVPPRRELAEGVTALVTLAGLSAFLISMPQGPWTTALPVALVFPLLLWVAVRCRPVFAVAAMFMVTQAIVWSATLRLGHFGDASIPLADRILAAQTLVLAGTLLALVLAALFSERRQSEATLQKSKERLQLALDGAEHGAFSADLATDLLECDARTAQIHGHVVLPATLKESRRFVHADDLVRIDNALATAWRNGGAWHAEYRVVPPPGHPHAGETRWIAVESSIVRNPQGTAGRLLGVTRDITERKHIEALLKDSKARLADALAAGKVMAFEWDAVTGLSERSENADQVLGSEARGKGFIRHVHADDRKVLKAHIHHLSPGNPSYTLEYRYVGPDNVEVWLEETAKGEFDATGKLVRIKGLTRNITERKQAELALAERDTQLALAAKAARVGSYTHDIKTKMLRFSEGYAAIYDLAEGTCAMTSTQRRALVHPEDLELLDRVRSQAYEQRRGEFSLEYRNILPNRGVRWIESRSLIFYGSDGQPQRVVGVNIDVTERRRTEQVLTDRNRQLELAGKHALVGSYAIEIDAGLEDFSLHRLQFSPGFAAIYGLSEDTTEISLGHWRSLVHPDDLLQFVKHRQQLFAERRSDHHAEHRIVLPCGTIRWIEARSFIEYDQAGHPKRMVGVNIDITERKRAEEARRVLNAELDHRVKNALATVIAVVSHTRQASGSVVDFTAALERRIRSMAATHDLLSSRHWQELSLMELIRCELAPYATGRNTEFSGPTVLLKPEAGQALALVLHELATNAAKYGALSSNTGRVQIRWDRGLNGPALSNLVLEWREVGGPRVDAPGKSSYGTSTIRDLIPYEFGGAVDLVFAPEGVRCRLELPPDWLSNAGEPTEVVNSAR